MENNNSQFWKDYNEVNNLLKQAFIQIPGGQAQGKQAQDAAAGGMPPPGVDPAAMGMDPAAMGMLPPGVDPAAMGMDPAAMGMPPPGMDPAAMGMPPPGVDPAMTGVMPPQADPAAAGGAPAAPGSPMITISLDQLFEIIQKVLGLAKKVGVNGQGIQQPTDQSNGLNADQLKATIYEALGSMAG